MKEKRREIVEYQCQNDDEQIAISKLNDKALFCICHLL